jgi:hypothetical protein
VSFNISLPSFLIAVIHLSLFQIRRRHHAVRSRRTAGSSTSDPLGPALTSAHARRRPRATPPIRRLSPSALPTHRPPQIDHHLLSDSTTRRPHLPSAVRDLLCVFTFTHLCLFLLLQRATGRVL